MSAPAEILIGGPAPSTPGCRLEICCQCHRAVYIAPASFERVDEGMAVMCLPCARQAYRAHPGPISVSPASQAEISEQLGRPLTGGDLAALVAEISRTGREANS